MSKRLIAGLLAVGLLSVAGCAELEEERKPAKKTSNSSVAGKGLDTDGDGVKDSDDADPVDAGVSSEGELNARNTPPEPEADSQLTCAYLLGDFGESGDPAQGYRLVGGGDVRNTGEVPARVEVRFSWEMLGAEPVRQQKTFFVKAGRTRRVAITVPVTQTQIDAHQAADGKCRSHAEIVG